LVINFLHKDQTFARGKKISYKGVGSKKYFPPKTLSHRILIDKNIIIMYEHCLVMYMRLLLTKIYYVINADKKT